VFIIYCMMYIAFIDESALPCRRHNFMIFMSQYLRSFNMDIIEDEPAMS